MSVRIWTCGGRVEFIRKYYDGSLTLTDNNISFLGQKACSRVGHVFRGTHPYPIDGQHVTNSKRLAAVWTDKEFRDRCKYFNEEEITKYQKDPTLQSRFELKKNLNCKDFRW